MKAFIIEFPIGGVITDGKKLLFNNSNAFEPELVPRCHKTYRHSTVDELEWQLKNSTVITEEQRESIAELRDAVKQLKSEGWEFDEGDCHALRI